MFIFLDADTRRLFQRDLVSSALWQVMVCGISSFAVVHAKRMGAPAYVVALFVSTCYFALSLAWIPRIMSRKKALGGVMLALKALASISLLFAAYHPGLTSLVVCTLASMLFAGMSDTVYPAVFDNAYPKDDHETLMGTIYGVRVIVGALVMLILGRILDACSLSQGVSVLAILGVFGILAVIVLWPFRSIKEAAAERNNSQIVDTPPHKNREFMVFLVAITFCGIGACIGAVCFPVLMADKKLFSFTNGQIGVITAAGLITQVVTSAWFTRYGRVTSSARHVGLPFVLQGMTMLASGLMLVTSHTITAAYIPVLIGFSVANVGIALQSCYQALMVNEMAGKSSVMHYQSTMGIVVGIRGTIVPLVTSWVYMYVSISNLVWVSFVLFVAGGLIALRFGTSVRQIITQQLSLEAKPSAS